MLATDAVSELKMPVVKLPSDAKRFVDVALVVDAYVAKKCVEVALIARREASVPTVVRLGAESNVPTLDDLIDHEFVEYCAREGDDGVTLDEVLEATSTIKDSMARVIIEEERPERF